MIAEQNEQVLIERRRAGVAPIDLERRDLFAEVTLPHEPPVHVERDELARAEPGEHRLPIGDRAGARKIVFLVHASQRPHRLDAVLPEPASIGAMKRLDDEDGAIGGGRATGGQRALAGRSRVRALHKPRMIARFSHAGADLRRHEDAFAGHDRRRHAEAAQ